MIRDDHRKPLAHYRAQLNSLATINNQIVRAFREKLTNAGAIKTGRQLRIHHPNGISEFVCLLRSLAACSAELHHQPGRDRLVS